MDAIIDVFMKETKSILRSKLSDAIFCNNTLLTEAKTYATIKFKEIRFCNIRAELPAKHIFRTARNMFFG